MPAGMGHPQPPWATCSVRHHPLGEKLPPHIQPKPALSQFKTIPPCPVVIHPRKQPFPLLFMHSLQVLEGHNEVSRSLLFFNLNNSNSLNLFSQERCSSPLLILVASSGLVPRAPCLSFAGGPRPEVQVESKVCVRSRDMWQELVHSTEGESTYKTVM